ncbi:MULTISPECIES: asparagine synthase-related protein [Streptomyces]|uniref:Asparagine synthase n=1 Tax=Streptomyces pseudovenezuelae TaxID=67350 RepID=A0A101N6K4_9ACTN|nr:MULTISPECIES: asparagine synthase-related protein [Streptomyces]KUM87469.1 asparagine synthase [Streptomyces pseudovenezuelae]
MMAPLGTLPPALGFLACAHTGAGAAPPGPVATRALHAEAGGALSAQILSATVLHGPGTDPGRAWTRAGDTVVVVAGEFYNQDELRSVLPGSPACDSDAELLAALFDRYDLHAFRLVNGRFAAVVASGARLCAATDHAGSVPLYLRPAPGDIRIATEAKALAAQGSPRGPALPGTRRVPGLPGVHQVPAGTVLELAVDSADGSLHRTWEPPSARRILSEDAACRAVRGALERAVERRLAVGTKPLVVLSGGIDSSAVAALAAAHGPLDTLSMGTDLSDEFPQAEVVARHLATDHSELVIPMDALLRRLPYTVWAAETLDADIVEYLLPLVGLYRGLPDTPRRVLTGYGADIPLAGMHREDRLPQLDTAVAHDMATFDGLNEMSPVLAAVHGHWTSHPYWDRDVLDLLVGLEAGLKRRHGRDKWVLRAAMTDLLPEETVTRPKLGVHEGSGVSVAFTRLLSDNGVPDRDIATAKTLVVRELFDRTVAEGGHPDQVSGESAIHAALRRLRQGAA